MDNHFQYGRCLTEDPSDSNTVYAGGSVYYAATTTYRMTVCKSTDAGQTWPTQVLLGIEGNYRTNCYDIALARDDSSIIYAGGEENGYVKIWRTEDGGTIWTDITGDLAALHSQYDTLYAVWVAPEDPDTVLVGTTDGVFKTMDAGASWSATPFAYYTRRLAYHPATDTLYAGTTSNGVYKSEDRGASWQALNDGLGVMNIKCMDLDAKNAFLYVGTNGGSVWRLSLPASPLWVDVDEISAATGAITPFQPECNTGQRQSQLPCPWKRYGNGARLSAFTRCNASFELGCFYQRGLQDVQYLDLP